MRSGLLLGDFLTNLRASLDHLAWNLVLANNGEPDEHTAFPIKVKEPRAKGSGEPVPLRISGGIAPDAMTIVESAQPYERRDGGDPATHPLWFLDRLVGVDKHRHFPLCIVGLQDIRHYFPDGTGGRHLHRVEMEGVRPLYEDAPISTIGMVNPAEHMDVDLEISTTVALKKGEPGGWEPLSGLCQTLLETTRNVLDALNDHAG